jgi:putative tryptophan/tyrosine transport system substrate-binding protein
MRRREFIGLIGSTAAWPLAARAQQPKKIPRLGYLGAGLPNEYSESFFRSLRELGYIDGVNIQIDARFAHGKLELLPSLANELISLKPDVLVGTPAIGAVILKQATSTIPIVGIAMINGARLGLFESLAHPGGNVTGTDSWSALAAAKRVALLKEIVPQLARVTLLCNPDSPYTPMHLDTVLPALQTLGLESQIIKTRSISDIDDALEVMQRDLPQAILVFEDPVVYFLRQRVIDFISEHKIPTIGENPTWVREGSLLVYGVDLKWYWSRGAYFVDQILKGANPATLPVEQPTRIGLYINLKTAKAFGLRIPEAMLATAEEVIE